MGTSIIIPAFNQERFIALAVQSALDQTADDVEVIVVDDGSTDGTREALRPFCSRIQYIYQRNAGVSAARNAGIRASQGEYVLFLDGDDLIPRHKVLTQATVLDTSPDVGVVYSAWNYFDERAQTLSAVTWPDVIETPLTRLLLRTFGFPFGAALIRRECLDRAGWFDESLHAAEDTSLLVALAAAGCRFAYVDQPLFTYRLVPGSLTSKLDHQLPNELRRLEKFFRRPDLTPEVLALRDRAVASIHLEFAAKYYNLDSIELGRHHLGQAFALLPEFSNNHELLLNWVAGSANSPRFTDPDVFIDRVFNHLPDELRKLQRLRRRAHGRFHAAMIFSGGRSRNVARLRSHIVPAVIGEPSVIWNRGFASIAARALIDTGGNRE